MLGFVPSELGIVERFEGHTMMWVTFLPLLSCAGGAPVSLCVNLNLQFKMFNGSVGRIVDVVFENGLSPHHDGKSWPL